MIRPRLGWAVRSLAAVSFLATASCTSGSGDQTAPPSAGPSLIAGAGTTCSMQVDDAASQSHAAFFAAVDAVGPNDVWAVGSQFTGGVPGTLIEHWDGSTWKDMLNGNGRPQGPQLSDVDIVNSDDVWAVGFVYSGARAMHWDGSRLTQVDTAQGLPGSNLLGLTALGSAHIWAVGTTPGPDGYDTTLIEHRDGSDWSVVPRPETAGYSAGLRDVDGLGPNSLWAVGWTVGTDKVYRPLVERRVGDRWVIVPTPRLADDATLSGVAVAGPNDVWAVGWSWNDDGSRSLVLHWNGSSWRVLHVTGPTDSTAHLMTAATAGRDIVTAGQAPDADGILQPVAFRLHGTAWTSHAVAAGSDGGGFQGITAVDGLGMIAVGIQQGEEGYSTLVQRGC
jgi:hypothetical protein